MKAAPLPFNEPARLKALHELFILNTPPEERFDRLARVAMNALKVPYAFINLVDSENQWCKSAPGNKLGVIHRSISFCAHTILGGGPLVIRDSLEDERFFDNSLVTHAPGYRSYLGVPIFSKDDLCLGALCVFDTKPREFLAEEVEIVRDLAAAVQNEMNKVELNKSLESIRLARKAAQAAIQSKKNFLAMVSHEIRTPMNGIIGMTEVLSESHLSEEQRDLLDTVRECTSRLLELIDDILDFSKIESGKFELERIAFAPRALIKHVLTLNSQVASKKGIVLESQVDENVPRQILGDPLRIGQVLLNLVGSALKSNSTGSIRVEVGVPHHHVQGNDSLLRFSVSAPGAGISAEEQKGHYQALSQPDSSIARNYGGTGLGLMISEQLVELMGGSIRREDTPGKGSTFSFSIANFRGADGHVAEATSISAPTSTYNGPALKILVVDDNLVNQKVFAHALMKIGQTAQFASGGLDCVERVQKEEFDIVFMDVQMPDLDGREAARRIRALPGHEKDSPWIVACTADAMPEDLQKCLESGMNDYTVKPLRLESLHSALILYSKVKIS